MGEGSGVDMNFDLDQFLKDRNEALLSLEEKKIRSHLRKYGQEPPEDQNVFWYGIHKAITACTALPKDFRQKSKAWLEVRGSQSMDDGDL
jgi:hypothetical protein